MWKLWQNTSYLQLGGINNWFHAARQFLFTGSLFAVQNLRVQWHLSPYLAMCLATVTDDHVAWILLLQLQTCRQLTMAMKRQIWYD